ncbi:MAG: aminotransferase class V-fold PLP-dependent enzyme [Planctomycetota bacterium]
MTTSLRPSSAPPRVEPLPCVRDQFKLPPDVCYLNCSYMSPLSHAVESAGTQGVVQRGRPWEIGVDDFFDPAERVRNSFAQLISGDAEGVAFIPAISYGVGIAAANADVRTDQSIVILAEQFPSNVYPWERLAAQSGADLVRVAYPEDHDLTGRVLDAITQRTAVVAIPSVHWTTGVRIGLTAVRDRLDEVGGMLVVDASQTVGGDLIDVKLSRPDYLVTVAYKAMLGPYGLAFLYADASRRQGVPLEEGWLNRQDSDQFGALLRGNADYRDGARRYDMGERASTILLPMAQAALDQMLSWGPDRVAAANRRLLDMIVGEVRELGLTAPDTNRCGANMVGITLQADAPKDLLDRLRQQQVYVNARGTRIRLAPHVYNDEADVDRFVQVLKEILE